MNNSGTPTYVSSKPCRGRRETKPNLFKRSWRDNSCSDGGTGRSSRTKGKGNVGSEAVECDRDRVDADQEIREGFEAVLERMVVRVNYGSSLPKEKLWMKLLPKVRPSCSPKQKLLSIRMKPAEVPRVVCSSQDIGIVE
jgi:hypothetical protein